MTAPSAYHFVWPFIPVGVNHRYGQRADGRRYTKETPAAQAKRISDDVWVSGFKPRLDMCYEVEVAFTFQTWSSDLDGSIKPLLDSVFGNDRDHRVTKLTVRKLVVKGVSQTEIWVSEKE